MFCDLLLCQSICSLRLPRVRYDMRFDVEQFSIVVNDCGYMRPIFAWVNLKVCTIFCYAQKGEDIEVPLQSHLMS